MCSQQKGFLAGIFRQLCQQLRNTLVILLGKCLLGHGEGVTLINSTSHSAKIFRCQVGRKCDCTAVRSSFLFGDRWVRRLRRGCGSRRIDGWNTPNLPLNVRMYPNLKPGPKCWKKNLPEMLLAMAKPFSKCTGKGYKNNSDPMKLPSNSSTSNCTSPTPTDRSPTHPLFASCPHAASMSLPRLRRTVTVTPWSFR